MHLFIGIKGCVRAIDRNTGEKVWKTELRGSALANVMLDGGELFAATSGELYRLDPATGKILWKNSLTGMGFGLVSFAQAADQNNIVMLEQDRQNQAAAADDFIPAATT